MYENARAASKWKGILSTCEGEEDDGESGGGDQR